MISNGSCKLSNGQCKKKVQNGSNEKCDNSEEKYSYEIILETADYLKERVPFQPKVGIICGSGLGALAQDLKDPIEFPYSSIPNFPVSTVEGHAGKLVFGYLSQVPIVCMQGRFHFYEGYPLWKCAMPVRVMKLMGVSQLIATNAAGGLNKKYKVGDIMLVKDHINFMGFAGNNPLQGPNEDRFGPRFPPMNKAYDKELIEKSFAIGEELGLKNNMHTGVYTCLGGPNFETVAELRALQMLGCDAVGMSTVHEVITARHCDMNVLAFSLITNEGILQYDTQCEPNHEEVMDAANMRQEILRKFVSRIIDYINKSKLSK